MKTKKLSPLEHEAEGIYSYRTNRNKFLIKVAAGSNRNGRKKLQTSETVVRLEHEDRAAFIRKCERRRLELLDELLEAVPAVQVVLKDSLRDGMLRYLLTIAGQKKRNNKEDCLLPIITALVDPQDPTKGTFGDQPMAWLKKEHLQQLIARFEVEPGQRKGSVGLAPDTVRARIGAVNQMFNTVGDVRSPTVGVKLPKKRQRFARNIALDDLEFVFSHCSSKGRHRDGTPRPFATKKRLMVMAHSGLSQKSLMRLEPGDLDLSGHRYATQQRDLKRGTPKKPGPVVWFHPRQKGGGVAGRWMPMISVEEVRAFAEFAEADLFGTFATQDMNDTWTNAIKRAAQSFETDAERQAFSDRFPPNVRAYDLRHSFLTIALKITKNYKAVAMLGQHADTKMLEGVYGIGAEDDVLDAAAQEISTALAARSLQKQGAVPLTLVKKEA